MPTPNCTQHCDSKKHPAPAPCSGIPTAQACPLQIAHTTLTAARTAPTACGLQSAQDTLTAALLQQVEIGFAQIHACAEGQFNISESYPRIILRIIPPKHTPESYPNSNLTSGPPYFETCPYRSIENQPTCLGGGVDVFEPRFVAFEARRSLCRCPMYQAGLGLGSSGAFICEKR